MYILQDQPLQTIICKQPGVYLKLYFEHVTAYLEASGGSP